MDKALSVSIASYNVQSSLEKAIYSIVKARNSDLVEIIVVNDGSTDNTLSIAKHVQSLFPDIIKVVDKENGGYGSTIVAALDVASGRYFKLLDGDDAYDTEDLEEYLNKLANSEVDMIISPFHECYKNGKRKRIEFDYLEKTNYCVDAINGDFTMHAVAFKTEVLKKTKLFLPQHCLYTDNLFCLMPLYMVKTFSYVDCAIYQYSLGSEGQSVSKTNLVRHIGDIKTVVKQALVHYNNTPINNGAEIVITNKVSKIYYAYLYSALLCPVSSNMKKQIVMFENKVKEKCPSVYYAVNNKNILVLRKTNYFLYPLVSWYKKIVR